MTDQEGFEHNQDYWTSLGIAKEWAECKCNGAGYCEYHDDYNPEDDSYA